MTTASRPAWVGFVIDIVAIVAAVVLVILGAIPGHDALAWVAFVQTGRLYIWATRRGRPKELPSESGLLLLLIVTGELARNLFSRHHLHS